jgi:hypothetical protein
MICRNGTKLLSGMEFTFLVKNPEVARTCDQDFVSSVCLLPAPSVSNGYLNVKIF